MSTRVMTPLGSALPLPILQRLTLEEAAGVPFLAELVWKHLRAPSQSRALHTGVCGPSGHMGDSPSPLVGSLSFEQVTLPLACSSHRAASLISVSRVFKAEVGDRREGFRVSSHVPGSPPCSSLLCSPAAHPDTNSRERSPASPSLASCTLSHVLMVISSSLRASPSFPPPRMSCSAHLEACSPTSSPDSAERF